MARWLRFCLLRMIICLVVLVLLAHWGYGIVKGIYCRFVADAAEAEAADLPDEETVNHEIRNSSNDFDADSWLRACGVSV